MIDDPSELVPGLILAGMLILSLVVGIEVSNSMTRADCDKGGQFRDGSKIYKCEMVKQWRGKSDD
jgi:hypothetical protein